MVKINLLFTSIHTISPVSKNVLMKHQLYDFCIEETVILHMCITVCKNSWRFTYVV